MSFDGVPVRAAGEPTGFLEAVMHRVWLDQPERPEMGGFRQWHRRERSRITIIVFARCLLVCPGNGRHCLTSAGTETGVAAYNPVLL